MSMAAYECTRGLHWTVETTGLLLVRPDTGVCCALEYPEAAVWDFLARGYGQPQMARMLRHIGGFREDAEAAQFIRDRLQAWQEAGLIVAKEGSVPNV
jgi:hypothetical protein